MKNTVRIISVMIITSIFFATEVKSQDYVINYSVSGLDPQSMVYYPAKKKFIISSSELGQVGYIDNKGQYKMLMKNTALTGASRMLIRDDLLYVLTNSSNSSGPQKPAQSRLVTLNLKTRTVISVTEYGKLHTIPSKTGTDLAIDNGGTIYIVDNSAEAIYKVKPGGATSILLANKVLRNTQSIVYHINGYLLVAADRSIYKIHLADSNFTKVLLEEDFEEINSLHFSPNHLLVLAEGGNVNKVHILNSSNSWASAKLLRTEASAYTNPNSIEYVDNKIYVLDSQLQSSTTTAFKSGDFSVHVVDLQMRSHNKRRKGTVTAEDLEIIK